MARTTPGVTRQRIVDEAARLFSRDGYAATSVADIHTACGLAPGSGGLYKHFPSKREVLSEIVRQHVATIVTGRQNVEPVLPDDPRAALELLARAVWAAMDADRDPIRIMVRELDQFPELLDRMWQGVSSQLYGMAEAWITDGVRAGRMRAVDPKATAAVLLASLTYYRILDATIGHPPGDVGEEEYLAAWVDHALATLQITV